MWGVLWQSALSKDTGDDLTLLIGHRVTSCFQEYFTEKEGRTVWVSVRERGKTVRRTRT